MIANRSSEKEGGILYGIGLGPGDPRLITLKALDILHACEVIFVPSTEKSTRGRACSILNSLNPAFLEKAHFLDIPMNSGENGKWTRAARYILANMDPDSVAAYASLGDPLLYGSFIHIARALGKMEARIRIAVVSGVNSFSAAAAQALFPLGIHSEKVAVLSGARSSEQLEQLLEQFETLVVLKLSGCLEIIRGFLENHPDEVEWICVENCGLNNQFICQELQDLARRRWGYFSVMLIRRR